MLKRKDGGGVLEPRPARRSRSAHRAAGRELHKEATTRTLSSQDGQEQERGSDGTHTERGGPSLVRERAPPTAASPSLLSQSRTPVSYHDETPSRPSLSPAASPAGAASASPAAASPADAASSSATTSLTTIASSLRRRHGMAYGALYCSTYVASTPTSGREGGLVQCAQSTA